MYYIYMTIGGALLQDGWEYIFCSKTPINGDTKLVLLNFKEVTGRDWLKSIDRLAKSTYEDRNINTINLLKEKVKGGQVIRPIEESKVFSMLL